MSHKDYQSLKLVTAPATEPVTLVEAKAHLRVDITADDTYITTLIAVARRFSELKLGRQIITATWELRQNRFGTSGRIFLPRPPLISITHVKYNDNDGNQQTWSNTLYDVSVDSIIGWVVPKFNLSYPDARNETDSIQIQYVAGYGAASAVPESIKQAILLMIGHLHEHREGVIVGKVASTMPMAVDALLDTERITEVA